MEFIPLRCLLLILLSCLLFSTTPASGKLVLDIDGDPVIRGYPYYIWAAQAIIDGYLGLGYFNGSCPQNVIQKIFPYGPPVMFFPEIQWKEDTVVLEEKVSIMFAAPSPCNESTMWVVNKETSLVTTGGVLLPSNETSSSRFRIGSYPYPDVDVYQFKLCPDPNPSVVCRALGIMPTGAPLLGVSTDILAVRFLKVPKESFGLIRTHPTA